MRRHLCTILSRINYRNMRTRRYWNYCNSICFNYLWQRFELTTANCWRHLFFLQHNCFRNRFVDDYVNLVKSSRVVYVKLFIRINDAFQSSEAVRYKFQWDVLPYKHSKKNDMPLRLAIQLLSNINIKKLRR